MTYCTKQGSAQNKIVVQKVGSDLEPGTHQNPLRPNLPGTRNPSF